MATVVTWIRCKDTPLEYDRRFVEQIELHIYGWWVDKIVIENTNITATFFWIPPVFLGIWTLMTIYGHLVCVKNMWILWWCHLRSLTSHGSHSSHFRLVGRWFFWVVVQYGIDGCSSWDRKEREMRYEKSIFYHFYFVFFFGVLSRKLERDVVCMFEKM